jgi:hypothetical protein
MYKLIIITILFIVSNCSTLDLKQFESLKDIRISQKSPMKMLCNVYQRTTNSPKTYRFHAEEWI